jgi:hypothetical protein
MRTSERRVKSNIVFREKEWVVRWVGEGGREGRRGRKTRKDAILNHLNLCTRARRSVAFERQGCHRNGATLVGGLHSDISVHVPMRAARQASWPFYGPTALGRPATVFNLALAERHVFSQPLMAGKLLPRPRAA